MFKYYETYTVTVSEWYDENDLQGIANDYKDYVEIKKMHNSNYSENYESFSDYVVDELHFHKELQDFDYDYEDGNTEELYNEVKKYL